MAAFGWNFRVTEQFAEDSAPDTFVLADPTSTPAQDIYPVTRNGIMFGVLVGGSSNIQGRNRNAGNPARFAGLAFSQDAATNIVKFQIDLPTTGDWTIRLAAGDPSGGVTTTIRLQDDFDNTFATISGTTSTENHFLDATSAERTSPSDWTTNNTPITHAFITTTFVIVLGDGVSTNGYLAHLDIESAGAPPAEGGWLRYRK